MSVFSENCVQQLKTAMYQNAHKMLLQSTQIDKYNMHHVQTLLKNQQVGGTGTRDYVGWKADDVFSNR